MDLDDLDHVRGASQTHQQFLLLKHLCVRVMVTVIGGLGPGGLDSWDPPYEGDCYLGAPHSNPKPSIDHQSMCIRR